MAAFERGKDRILEVAAGKLGIPASGTILVGTFDF